MHTRRTCPPCGGRRAASRWMRTARRSSSRARRTSHRLARRSRQAPTWRRWRGRWPSNGARHDRSTRLTGHRVCATARRARAHAPPRRGRRATRDGGDRGCGWSAFERAFPFEPGVVFLKYCMVKLKFTRRPGPRARPWVWRWCGGLGLVRLYGSATSTTGQPQPAATVEERSYWGGEAAQR